MSEPTDMERIANALESIAWSAEILAQSVLTQNRMGDADANADGGADGDSPTLRTLDD